MEKDNIELKKIQWVETADCEPMPELGRSFYNPAHYNVLRSALYQEGWNPAYPARALLKEGGKYEIFVGVHRLKIAKEIGITRIPIILELYRTKEECIIQGIRSNTLQGQYIVNRITD